MQFLRTCNFDEIKILFVPTVVKRSGLPITGVVATRMLDMFVQDADNQPKGKKKQKK